VDFYQECHKNVLAVRNEIDSVNYGKSDVERLIERFGEENVNERHASRSSPHNGRL
jgi:ADP-dependent phosphofructokinase/glucokinase